MIEGNILFSIIRILLYPIAPLYGAMVWLRNRMYDSGLFSSIRFSVPVISVGNLSTGGTGKTPHVEYLIRLLQYQYRVATMSRGYKRRTQGFLIAGTETDATRVGDEPMQYHLKYPDITVSVAEDRMTGIPALLQHRPHTDVVILDDAYQHRSVKPGLNILITDYSAPYYKDHILPFGNLRESRSASKRADVIIVSKCPDNLTRQQAEEMRQQLKPLPHQQVFFTGLHYNAPYQFFGSEPADITGKHALLVCGIARPEPLESFIRKHVAGIHTLPYKDHHYFNQDDLEEMKTAFDNWKVDDKIMITTEKDATRLRLHANALASWNIPIVIMPVEVHVLFGMGPQLDMIINGYIDRTMAENQEAFAGMGNFPPM